MVGKLTQLQALDFYTKLHTWLGQHGFTEASMYSINTAHTGNTYNYMVLRSADANQVALPCSVIAIISSQESNEILWHMTVRQGDLFNPDSNYVLHKAVSPLEDLLE